MPQLRTKEDVKKLKEQPSHSTSERTTRPAYQRLRGEAFALSCEMTSPYFDGFYAKWLTLNQAWSHEVILPPASARVPPRLRWFATAFILQPVFCTDDANVRSWFTLEGHSPSKVVTLGCVAAWRCHVARCIHGNVMYIAPVAEDEVHNLSRHREEVLRRLLQGFVAFRASDHRLCHMRLQGPAGSGKS